MTEGIWVAVISIIGGGLIKGLFDITGQFLTNNKKMDILLKDIEIIKQDVSNNMKISLTNRDGLKYMQRYRLQHDMQKAILKGNTTTQQLNELSILYESYRHLGGNGAVEALYQRFITLTIKEENEPWNN